ncbi:hypothetical protein V8G54_012091 [Vigna mungo]|uniref:Uncharacterized protein n=1 Tax=Vigna mungo TaxID=3915 RepID=A0AAQ3NRL0_VIGMU
MERIVFCDWPHVLPSLERLEGLIFCQGEQREREMGGEEGEMLETKPNHMSIFPFYHPKIKVLHLGETFLRLHREKKENVARGFASMEDDFMNCAAHGSMKKTNLVVGEDDGPGVLHDSGKDCRTDDEALDLDDAWLMCENEDSNGVGDAGSGSLRKSCDGGGAEVIWVAWRPEDGFVIWGRLLHVMAAMVLCRCGSDMVTLDNLYGGGGVRVTREKVGFWFLFGLKVEEDGDAAEVICHLI